MIRFLGIIIALTTGILATENQKGVEGLSGDTRSLLAEEMRHIEKGMHSIFSNIVKGEYEEISKMATDIHDSFIFTKSLTQAQREELKTNLPQGFIELDRSFHATAGKLSEAAEFEEKKAVEENFSKMMGLCVQCHSTYATQRFKTFSE
ncbi:cytochrome c [Sulfurovum sp. zt1-1]|uniref:Cytochrome c n=1 Tax=Sulfurovum zhangzhouensis TaxID=3019067 RepID=A0ABT7QVS0_9BACT|nr:cytochrome c [Sulfurovum zhangzhouensis]MDM5270826.1 cytochrome c [Sulfurovum zhangzhouensis]